jgi:hypothetical protein
MTHSVRPENGGVDLGVNPDDLRELRGFIDVSFPPGLVGWWRESQPVNILRGMVNGFADGQGEQNGQAIALPGTPLRVDYFADDYRAFGGLQTLSDDLEVSQTGITGITYVPVGAVIPSVAIARLSFRWHHKSGDMTDQVVVPMFADKVIEVMSDAQWKQYYFAVRDLLVAERNMNHNFLDWHGSQSGIKVEWQWTAESMGEKGTFNYTETREGRISRLAAYTALDAAITQDTWGAAKLNSRLGDSRTFVSKIAGSFGEYNQTTRVANGACLSQLGSVANESDWLQMSVDQAVQDEATTLTNALVLPYLYGLAQNTRELSQVIYDVVPAVANGSRAESMQIAQLIIEMWGVCALTMPATMLKQMAVPWYVGSEMQNYWRQGIASV